MAVRWFRDTITYRNSVSDAWDSGRMDDLKEDANKAHREAIADIFRWRKKINSTREKLMELARKEKEDNGG